VKGWYRLILVGMISLLVAALFIDRAGLLLENSAQSVGIIESAVQRSFTLRPCESQSGIYSGPLIPTPDQLNSYSRTIQDQPKQPIPANAWSHRAGFSVSTSTDADYWAGKLGSGWYLDWRVQIPVGINYLEYWPMIRVHEDCISPSVEEIHKVAANFMGLTWIIGNEPDVIWQDNVDPVKYAIIYHELYMLIKSTDPTALLAVGGVSQATPLRLQYLDKVLQAYQDIYNESMPVDWWTVHGYVLREEKGSWGVEIPPGIDTFRGELYEINDHGRVDLFEAQIRSFRQWMEKNGYQDKPLALTEFGILMPASYGFPGETVADYLETTFTWLSQSRDESTGFPEDGYRLVQKWAWFSISDPTYSNSDLGDLSNGKLTSLGENYRRMVSFMVP
jgi:hypothetical protein